MAISGQVARLNGKSVFILWDELGSLAKVRDYMTERGIINQNTGNPYNLMTLWTTAHRWVIENPEEAHKYYEKYGKAFEGEKWERHLIQRALSVYSRTRFLRWCRRMGYAEKYGINQLIEVYSTKGKYRKNFKKSEIPAK